MENFKAQLISELDKLRDSEHERQLAGLFLQKQKMSQDAEELRLRRQQELAELNIQLNTLTEARKREEEELVQLKSALQSIGDIQRAQRDKSKLQADVAAIQTEKLSVERQLTAARKKDGDTKNNEQNPLKESTPKQPELSKSQQRKQRKQKVNVKIRTLLNCLATSY